MMKRLLLVPVMCAAAMPLGATSDCKCDYTGHTFLAVRPQFQTAMPEKITMMRDRMDAREDGKGGALELTMFGGQSTSQDGMRNYFFPHVGRKLEAREQSNLDDILAPIDERDLNARHFRVVTQNQTFASSITMCPRQSTFGIGLNWRENVSKWMNYDKDADYNYFFEVSSPLTWVKNDLRFDEDIIDDGGGVADAVAGLPETQVFAANMEEAFKQKAWKYGKICGSRSKWGLADIEFKIGAVWRKGEKCHSEGYIGVLFPTGNKPKAEYLFEPMIGHNKHFGMISGSSSRFNVWTSKEDESKHLQFTWDLHGMYLFESNECRSFDVKCHPWSRYMSVYENEAQANQAFDFGAATAGRLLDSPGINYFTKNLKVTPGFSCNATTGIVYSNDTNGFRGEVGYNCYAREKECVKLACKWDEEVAFRFMNPVVSEGQNTVGEVPYPYAQINDHGTNFPSSETDIPVLLYTAVNAYENAIVQEADLNLDSATQPGYFAHTFYLSLAKRWEEREHPLYLSGGASYEYATTNAGLDRWLLWIKGGVSF